MLLRACIAFLLAVLLLTATARSAQSDSSTAAEKIRITSGPTVEHAGAEDAIVAWSTNVSSGTQVLYGTDRAHLTRLQRHLGEH